MWRWLRWLWLVAVIPVSITMPVIVEADNSAEITVTAVGYVCAAPGGFTLTYITDYEVGISWIKGAGADNTIIRAAIGRIPENREDGWLVYYGDGTNTTSWTNMETLSDPVYYRAWSQNAGGIWEEVGASDYVEGISMQLLAFLIAAIGLTIGGYWLKNIPLVYGAGGVWAVLAGYSYQKAVTVDFGTWDTFGMLFWIAIAMIIVCMVEPMILRRSRATGLAEEVADLTEEETEAQSFNKQREEMDKRKGMYRSRRTELRERANNRKLSKFARTGEVE